MQYRYLADPLPEDIVALARPGRRTMHRDLCGDLVFALGLVFHDAA